MTEHTYDDIPVQGIFQKIEKKKTGKTSESFIKVYASFIRSEKYSANEKLVLIYLRSRAAPPDYTCFPSYRRISRELGLSKTTVASVIKQLVTKGKLGVTASRQRAKANSYQVPQSLICTE